MVIKIEERKDYELYVTRELKAQGYPEKQIPMFVVIMMTSFDDGVSYALKNLEVEINE